MGCFVAFEALKGAAGSVNWRVGEGRGETDYGSAHVGHLYFLGAVVQTPQRVSSMVMMWCLSVWQEELGV